jgi:murein DD-endopeptidase MepM/ murein hydrolase activator NlpD
MPQDRLNLACMEKEGSPGLNRTILRIGLILVFMGGLAVGCRKPVPYSATLVNSVPTLAGPTIIPSPAYTTAPSSTPMPMPMPTPVPICSPLSDFSLLELQTILSNPFSPPAIADARDGGHHGVDFAYYSNPKTGKEMLGAPIQAVFPGRVASVSTDRPPYGNLILIETPLEDLPEEIQALFDTYPEPTPSAVETHLSCPATGILTIKWDTAHPSLYTLYAHMNLPVDYQIGDEVGCGQVIGQVGTSGSSVNPHLHLEMRYGPGGASFESLAHYSGDATPEEMAAYCIWRVSGIFQAIDPMRVLATANQK